MFYLYQNYVRQKMFLKSDVYEKFLDSYVSKVFQLQSLLF
jgi:hypothetical protein